MPLREFQITESVKEIRLQKVTLNGSKVLGGKKSSHKLLQQSVFCSLVLNVYLGSNSEGMDPMGQTS